MTLGRPTLRPAGCARRTLKLMLSMAWLIACSEAGAKKTQDPELITASARGAVLQALKAPEKANVSLTFAPLSDRLRLPACGQALAAKPLMLNAQGGPFSIEVRCSGGPSWRLYVQGEASLNSPVLLAARDLPRGTVLAKADLTFETRALHRLPGGYALKPEDLLGRRLRQPLQAGQVVSPRATAAPLWVRLGEPVTLTSGQGGLAVRMEGIALSNGTENATVRVRNARSQRVMQGRVVAPGTVALGH